ncbi:putative membrane protein YedE/YeeE [Neisseria sp. HSC-16F19]|nr:putative membrane protein YedE/YeeE [Neisseria sp. HSC-16F19]
MLTRLLAVLLGIWLGAQLVLGYVAAPVLFAHLPRLQAGHIAGVLFSIQSYFGLAVWALAAYVGRTQQARSLLKSRSLKLMAVLWALLAVNEWLVTPVINALKTGGSHWLLALTGGSFGLWHGVASSLYLLVSLLGLYLVARWLRFEWR